MEKSSEGTPPAHPAHVNCHTTTRLILYNLFAHPGHHTPGRLYSLRTAFVWPGRGICWLHPRLVSLPCEGCQDLAALSTASSGLDAGKKKKKKLCLPQSPALLQNMSTLEPITLVSGCKMAVTPCLNDQYCSVLLHPHYFLESTSNNHNRPVHLHINRMLHSTELEIRNIRVYQTRVIFLKFLFNLISEEMVLTILECYSAMPFRALPV